MTEDKPLCMDFHSVGFIPRLPPHTKNSDGNRHRSFHVPACRTSAAALSAAVDATQHIRKRPRSQAQPPPNTRPPQPPAALQTRGVWGESRLLSEKPPLPPESPPPSPHLSGRKREGGGLSEERPPPSIFIYPYFPAAVNVPTSTEDEPTPLAGKIKSLPMARMFLSTS